ncbi:MAG: polysaccharide deacetylase family protein [Bacteroidia bacterium]|jgi:peptidoglycan/xylan/chitin deacetylase (PgdA/CDA1 family)|nr:polysaccharide deacetylase family protein [Paludibacter sp.]NCB68371.1 polysaccharide deacetylase family protein [Bacteroidia bacterium]
MNKKQILFTSFILLFSMFSCKKSQDNHNADKALTDTVIVNKTAVVTKNTAQQILEKPQVPVLCYHRIDNETKGDYSITPATLEAHMKALSDSGYTSIQPTQLYDYLVYNKAIPDKSVMITFDDSRTEHFEIAAPVMEKYGFRGVFFIMTITLNKKNYMDTTQIATLAARGHEIGLHSMDHTMATKYKTDADWETNVNKPIQKLSQITHKQVDYWAYPNGVFNTESAAKLQEHFKLSFILSQKRDSVYPLQTVRRVIIPDISTNSLMKSIKRNF